MGTIWTDRINVAKWIAYPELRRAPTHILPIKIRILRWLHCIEYTQPAWQKNSYIKPVAFGRVNKIRITAFNPSYAMTAQTSNLHDNWGGLDNTLQNIWNAMRLTYNALYRLIGSYTSLYWRSGISSTSVRNSVFSRVERSETSGKTLNFSHEWKKSQIFNMDECKYLFFPFQLKNKACRFHSFIRMSMSCLLHKVVQRHVQCSKYTLI